MKALKFLFLMKKATFTILLYLVIICKIMQMSVNTKIYNIKEITVMENISS